MNDLITAAQQALEALEAFMEDSPRPYDAMRGQAAITALRAALAQPQGRKTGKPRNATTRLGVVCFEAYARSDVGSNRWEIAAEAVRAALAQQAEPVEPVAYRHLHEDGWEYHDAPTGEDCTECQALYTAPPQRKPLSEEEIERLWYPNTVIAEPGKRRVAFGRAVERAHGITGDSK